MKKLPLVISGGRTSQLPNGDWIGPKNNPSANVAPVVSNDSSQGYEVQSRWTDTATGKEYVCTDPTVGAAVWTETTGGGGGSDQHGITQNQQSFSAPYSIQSGYNGIAVGPLTINLGGSITVPLGSTLLVL